MNKHDYVLSEEEELALAKMSHDLSSTPQQVYDRRTITTVGHLLSKYRDYLITKNNKTATDLGRIVLCQVFLDRLANFRGRMP